MICVVQFVQYLDSKYIQNVLILCSIIYYQYHDATIMHEHPSNVLVLSLVNYMNNLDYTNLSGFFLSFVYIKMTQLLFHLRSINV